MTTPLAKVHLCGGDYAYDFERRKRTGDAVPVKPSQTRNGGLPIRTTNPCGRFAVSREGGEGGSLVSARRCYAFAAAKGTEKSAAAETASAILKIVTKWKNRIRPACAASKFVVMC